MAKQLTMKRPVRTREELKSSLSEVFFTFDQIGSYHNWQVMLEESNVSRISPVYRLKMMHNSAMCASLIHLRTLNEFFAEGGCKDDIRANDFPGFDARNPGPFLTDSEKVEINKRTAHLTWHRLNLDLRPFPVRGMMQQAISGMLQFLEYLQEDFLSLVDEELGYVKRLQRVLPEFFVEMMAVECVESLSDPFSNTNALRSG